MTWRSSTRPPERARPGANLRPGVPTLLARWRMREVADDFVFDPQAPARDTGPDRSEFHRLRLDLFAAWRCDAADLGFVRIGGACRSPTRRSRPRPESAGPVCVLGLEPAAWRSG